MREIHLQMKLSGDGFPTPDELDLRYELEDWIEETGIGIVLEAGGGGGVMDIFVEPAAPDTHEQLARMITERGLSDIMTLRVIEG
jgi:hypothetical protein